jgi:glycerophosphoryl diester phosphodiesterase
LKLGATGLESDVWLTSDGEAVLDHDGVAKSGVRRRRIADVRRSALPSHIPTLAELYDTCGAGFQLSLDVKDASAAEEVVRVARAAGGAEATGRLWLCHPDWRQVAAWRALDDDVKLVDSTRIHRMKEGAERRAANLAEAGVDAVNLHASDWTTGRVTLFHRFELYCFGWDAQLERIITELLGHGVDGVFSDHVDRLMDAINLAER